MKCYKYLRYSDKEDKESNSIESQENKMFENDKTMTSSNALKCVVSDYETTTEEVAPRKQ